MVTTDLMVRLEAKAGKEEELASFLVDALPLVEEEPETVAWLAVRADASSFAIVDVFPNQAGRQAHLEGAVARALGERGGDGQRVGVAVHRPHLAAGPDEVRQPHGQRARPASHVRDPRPGRHPGRLPQRAFTPLGEIGHQPVALDLRVVEGQ